MKNYDNSDNYRKRTHTVRITLQSGEFKGHIAYKVGGNCLGLELLEWLPEEVEQEDIDIYVENDCEFKLIEDGALFSIKLKDDDGAVYVIEPDDDDIRSLIVGIKIIDCEVQE
jgi:hypothetical protein